MIEINNLPGVFYRHQYRTGWFEYWKPITEPTNFEYRLAIICAPCCDRGIVYLIVGLDQIRMEHIDTIEKFLGLYNYLQGSEPARPLARI
jgi:hypothetical protein